jgi:hypothetical protein
LRTDDLAKFYVVVVVVVAAAAAADDDDDDDDDDQGVEIFLKIQSNSVITTSVYETPRLLRQIFCGTN